MSVADFQVKNYRRDVNSEVISFQETMHHIQPVLEKNSQGYLQLDLDLSKTELIIGQGDEVGKTESYSTISMNLDLNRYNRMLYVDFCLVNEECKNKILAKSDLKNLLMQRMSMSDQEADQYLDENNGGYYTNIVEVYKKFEFGLEITPLLEK